MISTIIDDRHAGSRVVARITNVLLMTTSSLIRIISGQLMAAAPTRPVHVWIVLLSSIVSVIGQGLFTVSSRVVDHLKIEESVPSKQCNGRRENQMRDSHLNSSAHLSANSVCVCVCVCVCVTRSTRRGFSLPL